MVILFAAGCENETMMESFSLNSCGEAGEKAEQVSGRTGTMWYNEELDEYRIQYAEPGTYDAVIVGIVCNLPHNWKDENVRRGMKVVFSGAYNEILDNQRFGPAGSKYYYLQITNLKKAGEQ